MLRSEIDYNINLINSMYDDYVEYVDSVSYTDEDEKEYTISDTLIENVKKSIYNSLQYLEELKKESLKEYSLILQEDTTLLNICFEIYNQVTEENIEKLINANDLLTYDRFDIDPNSPILKRGMEIIYYK